MTKILLSTILIVNLHAESLNELIDIALKNNTTIKQATIELDNKHQAVTQSKSLYLPTVSLESDISKHNIKASGITTKGDSNSIGLNASQLLYDFGSSTNKIEASKENYKASKEELATTSANIILNVKKVYYDILNKYALVDVAKESVKIDELQLYQAVEYFKAKVKTKIDVTNAKLQLSNSELELLKAEFDLKKSQTKLISLLSTSDALVEPVDKDISLLAHDVKNDIYNLKDLLQKAQNNRPELLMYNHLQNALTNNYEASKNDYYPSINLIGSHKDSNSDDIVSLDTTQSTAGVLLKWEIFSGFRTEASTKEALNQLNIIKEQLKEQKLKIHENVTSAYFDVEQNKQSINISLLNIKLAKQNLDLAQERYINGLNDIVELNDAKFDFIAAKSKLVNQYYAYKIAESVLEYEIGIELTNKITLKE